jgi:hypothetical protein
MCIERLKKIMKIPIYNNKSSSQYVNHGFTNMKQEECPPDRGFDGHAVTEYRMTMRVGSRLDSRASRWTPELL